MVLTHEYMKSRKINIKGIIFNNYIAGNIMHEDNIRMCEHLTGLLTLAKVAKDDTELDIDINILTAIYQ